MNSGSRGFPQFLCVKNTQEDEGDHDDKGCTRHPPINLELLGVLVN